MLVILFFFGLCFGSFFLVVIDRLSRGESIVVGRSHCDFCRHTLSWFDLLPVLSFLSTQARCRYCHRRLSYKYPVIEILSGLLFIFTWLGLPLVSPTLSLTTYIIVLIANAVLFVIFFSDFFYGIIPFPVVLAGLVDAAFLLVVVLHGNYLQSVVSALGAFLFFLLLYVVTRGRGIGFGDVVYALLMGFLLGFPKIIVGMYVAFLTGAVVSLILVLLGRKKLAGSTISFGPFLVIGTLAGLYYGDVLYRFFLGILHLGV